MIWRYHKRDYLERTIETVRNHRDADNCCPSLFNILADEIERLWALAPLYQALHKAAANLWQDETSDNWLALSDALNALIVADTRETP